jgi:hypothetical protein
LIARVKPRTPSLTSARRREITSRTAENSDCTRAFERPLETTFHMIKSKPGDAPGSRTRTAQINEALCKVLCHNICRLIQSMFGLNLEPKFRAEVA